MQGDVANVAARDIEPREAREDLGYAFLIFRGREVNAKSIMGVMMLAAGVGNPITLRTDGADEEAAINAMVDLFQRKFDEGA